ncbi:hypothetical protein ACFLR1_02815 [Bacteroidota bacterium]
MKYNRKLLFFILICACIHFGLRIQDGHNWGGDFSLYVAQSMALLNGTLDELFTANKFTQDNSSKPVGPYLVPPGFPTILTPVIFLFGLNFVALKILCCTFFFASLLVVHRLFSNTLNYSWIASGIVFGLCMNKGILKYADHVLSDFPFLFFCLLAILLLQKRESLYANLFLGTAMFAAFSIRHIGVVLLPTLLVTQIFSYRHTKQPIRQWILVNASPYVLFAVLILLTNDYQWLGGHHQVEVLTSSSFQSIGRNLAKYAASVSIFLVGNMAKILWIQVITLIIALPIIIAGMVLSIRKWPSLTIFTAIYLISILIYPRANGLRYLFPIIPFMLFFILLGATKIDEKINQFPVFRTLVIICFLNMGFLGMKSSYSALIGDSNTSFSKEMQLHYEYIKTNVDSEDVIGFFKPRVLRLYTGINTVFDRNGQYASPKTDYALISNNSETNYLNPVFSTEKFTLYKLE